jgi:hypothetical protein
MDSLEEIQYLEARKKVKKKKGFYWHLGSFMIVGIFFFLINIFTDPSEVWFHLPMISWSIGLGFHYIGVFGIPFIGTLDKDWEAQEIKREMARMNAKQNRRNNQSLIENNHEIDELDLDNDYHFDRREERVEDWGKHDERDMKDLRKDFNNQFDI